MTDTDDHRHHTFAFQIGDAALNFRPAQIDDPVPTGLQLIDLAGFRPAEDYMAFQLFDSGILEQLRPDETIDLRARGVEKVVIFKTDRAFRFQLDGRTLDWGATTISGAVLKRLAGVDSIAYGVWQEVRGGEDRPIANDETADLSAPGIEHFFTGIIQTTEG